jgi:CYTH domain-containing protein
MKFEIERKFLVKKLPKLNESEKIRYERYFLKINDNIEERIQKKGEFFEFERNIKISNLERKTEKKIINKSELEILKQKLKAIIRDSYKLTDFKESSIKIYY